MSLKQIVLLLLILLTISPAYSQVYYIVNQQDGKVLDLPSTSTLNGEQIQQWDLAGGNNQWWQLVNLANGYFEVINRQSGKVLDLPATSTANGTVIQQWDWVGGANQQWAFVNLGNGYFEIRNQQDGKVLDLPSTQTANGVKIQQWDWAGGTNQHWQLVPAPPQLIISDLTTPSMAPSFLAGDAYRYEIFGAANQQVSVIQNGTRKQVGSTDGNGYFVLNGTQLPGACGNYTQTWFVGNTQIGSNINFAVVPKVTPYNQTHPNLTPNYVAGDTYHYTIVGPPNQPVYAADNNAAAQYWGQTDANGTLVVTGVEQSGWIGSYTQVWSVGNQTASPALSFVVGQFGATGTVTTTDVGQTSDGHLEGVSTLSITNGAVSTYSATILDYTASLYYDSDTVATLFDNGAQIRQAVPPVSSSTSANLSASANAWDDYDLQTDHYAIAYLLNGGYYENPL